MNVITKKHQLDKKFYIRTSLKNTLKKLWWVWLIPAALLITPAFYAPLFWWVLIPVVLFAVFFPLFWWIQFVGVTKHPQATIFFEKLIYEFSSQMILISQPETAQTPAKKMHGQHKNMPHLKAKQGMPIKWEQIQRVDKIADDYLLVINKAQFFQIPTKIFKNEHDLKLFERLLKQKNYIKE